tara:strand:+ start:627 stop:827 length:201 start_codon:yes stop_codon:yes gene_type:complete
MRYGRQNVLLEDCPEDAFAYTHGRPAEPSKWKTAALGALHLQVARSAAHCHYASALTHLHRHRINI